MDEPAAPLRPDAVTAAEEGGRQPFSNGDRPSVPSPATPGAARSAARMQRLLWLLGLLVVLLVVPTLVRQTSYAFHQGKERAEVETALDGLDQLNELNLRGLSEASRLVSQAMGPSVVHIRVTRASGRRNRLTFPPFNGSSTGQGSGVIVDKAGYVVTNAHVVEEAVRIDVVLSDRRTLPATLLGGDKRIDIAVLKVSAENLSAAPWGDSESVNVGDLVWAVGSPFGLDRSVTFGIVSATGRGGLSRDPIHEFLQTDAAVNPGNSGGPLVDITGRVVGINTAILGDKYAGVSFAIPSQRARQIYEQIVDKGKVVRGWLGVEPIPVPEEMAQSLQLKIGEGAWIRSVTEDSPAERAGLQVNDVLTHWNGEQIEKSSDLFWNVAATEVGETVSVAILRNGTPVELQVTVGKRPKEIDY